MSAAIGGYFGLTMPAASTQRYAEAQYFQSARACFYALLQKGRPKRVWLPFYNCDAMLGPLDALGVEYAFYAINDDFSVAENVELATGEWLVYVNYFGLCDLQQADVLQRFNPQQVIFDHAQAYFSLAKECLATLYSPRKFFGMPDGGLLISRLKVEQTPADEEASHRRMTHLLKRFADSAEAGYADYQVAEESLEVFDASEMSLLSRRLLACADSDEVMASRNQNFRMLHEALAEHNALAFDLSALRGPLCYPFLCNENETVRLHLLSKKVYSARYWSECQARCAEGSRESTLSRLLLPLPCDQRYGAEQMQYIIANVKKGLSCE